MGDLISIVVPVYNGENSLEELYSALKKTASANNFKIELIFVDDNSSDKSYNQILELHKIILLQWMMICSISPRI
jgi:undecaprenyl-phosphate 4-deoxy-4-formamido-L-arabinose transferase